MVELWVPDTVAAAFLQNLRSALQKHLKARLSTTGATFVRFGFGFPPEPDRFTPFGCEAIRL